MLFDQMKAVVISDRRGAGGRLIENPEFRGFSDHWGFRIRAYRPNRARTKGKVERPIRHLLSSFFDGREFVSDDDSGGGLFGSNSEIVYRAPYRRIFRGGHRGGGKCQWRLLPLSGNRP